MCWGCPLRRRSGTLKRISYTLQMPRGCRGYTARSRHPPLRMNYRRIGRGIRERGRLRTSFSGGGFCFTRLGSEEKRRKLKKKMIKLAKHIRICYIFVMPKIPKMLKYIISERHPSLRGRDDRGIFGLRGNPARGFVRLLNGGFLFLENGIN